MEEPTPAASSVEDAGDEGPVSLVSDSLVPIEGVTSSGSCELINSIHQSAVTEDISESWQLVDREFMDETYDEELEENDKTQPCVVGRGQQLVFRECKVIGKLWSRPIAFWHSCYGNDRSGNVV